MRRSRWPSRAPNHYVETDPVAALALLITACQFTGSPIVPAKAEIKKRIQAGEDPLIVVQEVRAKILKDWANGA